MALLVYTPPLLYLYCPLHVRHAVPVVGYLSKWDGVPKRRVTLEHEARVMP